MKRLATPFLALVLALLVGCAQLGLATPQTFNQRAAAAQSAITQVRITASQLVLAKSITANDADNVLAQTDHARQALDLARLASATDPAGADAKLRATMAVLTALQGYLATKAAR